MDQVRAMLKEGQSIRAIARHFNCGVATIDCIKRKPIAHENLAVLTPFVRTGPSSHTATVVEIMRGKSFSIFGTSTTAYYSIFRSLRDLCGFARSSASAGIPDVVVGT